MTHTRLFHQGLLLVVIAAGLSIPGCRDSIDLQNDTHDMHTGANPADRYNLKKNGMSEAEMQEHLLTARRLTQELGSGLMAELQHAIVDGGPVNGIKVCKIVAPDLAASLSTQSRWSVGRTSLQTRNPNNRPDAWEQKILLQFEERKTAGADAGSLEHYAEVMLDGKPAFRYMKAIPTAEFCLACHGQKLAEPVRDVLAEHYPHDQATGYKAGDLRGAFTIIHYKDSETGKMRTGHHVYLSKHHHTDGYHPEPYTD